MCVRIEDKGDRLIVWNRSEKRGALSPEFYGAIREAIETADELRFRAVILTGAGSFFCAGGDLTILVERAKMSLDERRAKIEDLNAVIRSIRTSPVPVICAVEGGAAGAGLSIALACDLITAAQGAKFVAAYVKAGLVPDGALTSAMARTLPRQLAMEMCLLAHPQTAQRLAEFGVVNELTEEGGALDAAFALADQLSLGPRVAQGVIRGLVAQGYEATEEAQLLAEADAMSRAGGGEEAAEGIRAFLEKRKPQF